MNPQQLERGEGSNNHVKKSEGDIDGYDGMRKTEAVSESRHGTRLYEEEKQREEEEEEEGNRNKQTASENGKQSVCV